MLIGNTSLFIVTPPKPGVTNTQLFHFVLIIKKEMLKFFTITSPWAIKSFDLNHEGGWIWANLEYISC